MVPKPDYSHKARVLREIMSTKSARFGRYDFWINFGTVLVAGVITFLGFYGVDNLFSALGLLIGQDLTLYSPIFSLFFNIFALALVTLVFLQLLFRFSARKSEADRAILTLTQLINFIGELSFRAASEYRELHLSERELIREKYEAVIAAIPPNTTEEYRAAKERLRMASPERSGRGRFEFAVPFIGDRQGEETFLNSIVSGSPELLSALITVSNYRSDFYVGGGVIRNAAWDILHGRGKLSPIEDIDVVYFDPINMDRSCDRVAEQSLAQRDPSVPWSVKNQARMYERNHEQPYINLEDAIRRWPESATAFCVRLGPDGKLIFVAPHGLSDIFRLIIAPTDAFIGREERILERAELKNWKGRWPRLKFMLPQGGTLDS